MSILKIKNNNFLFMNSCNVGGSSYLDCELKIEIKKFKKLIHKDYKVIADRLGYRIEKPNFFELDEGGNMICVYINSGENYEFLSRDGDRWDMVHMEDVYKYTFSDGTNKELLDKFFEFLDKQDIEDILTLHITNSDNEVIEFEMSGKRYYFTQKEIITW